MHFDPLYNGTFFLVVRGQTDDKSQYEYKITICPSENKVEAEILDEKKGKEKIDVIYPENVSIKDLTLLFLKKNPPLKIEKKWGLKKKLNISKISDPKYVRFLQLQLNIIGEVNQRHFQIAIDPNNTSNFSASLEPRDEKNLHIDLGFLAGKTRKGLKSTLSSLNDSVNVQLIEEGNMTKLAISTIEGISAPRLAEINSPCHSSTDAYS